MIALVTRVPPGDLPSLLATQAAREAIAVTVRTNLIANLLIVAIGTPAAYALARRAFRGRSLMLTLIELPLVLPPAVAGVALIAAFGTRGLVGGALDARGIVLPFTAAAVVVAVAFVAAPFYLRAAITAFESIDQHQLDAARDLGASEAQVLRLVALPLALDGLRTGWALAFGRGVGEFGATLIFAGSVAGLTQTLPLAVYAELAVDLDLAVALGVLLLALSAAVLLVAKLTGPTGPGRTSTPRGGW